MALAMSPHRYSSHNMVKRISVLIDETPFVYLARNDGGFGMKAELARFIEMSRKTNKHAQFEIHSTCIVKQKLGLGFFYGIKNAFCRNQRKKKLYQKRLERQELAHGIIRSYKKPQRFSWKSSQWTLMDLHLFANENKRETLSRPLQPQEVIPLDVCMNAVIAYRTGYPLFSFNTDYQYFIGLPYGKKTTIQYWKPEDILKQLPL